MSSTLGDLLREVARARPEPEQLPLNGTLPVRYRARTRARGRMEEKIRSRILPNVNSAAIGALQPAGRAAKARPWAGGPEIGVAALAVARLRVAVAAQK